MLGLLWMAVSGIANFITESKEARYNWEAKQNYNKETGTYYDRRGRTRDAFTNEIVQIHRESNGDITVHGDVNGHMTIIRNISENERLEEFEREKNNPNRTETVMTWGSDTHSNNRWSGVWKRDFETGDFYVERDLSNLPVPNIGRTIRCYVNVNTGKVIRPTDLAIESNNKNRAGEGYFARKPFSDEEIADYIERANNNDGIYIVKSTAW